MVDIHSCTYEINILYLTRFSIRSSISELEAVMLSDYLLTECPEMYCKSVLHLLKYRFSLRSSISELEAVMLSDLLRT